MGKKRIHDYRAQEGDPKPDVPTHTQGRLSGIYPTHPNGLSGFYITVEGLVVPLNRKNLAADAKQRGVLSKECH